MKARLSPLTLIDFAITNCEFKFIPPEEDINIKEVAASYDIDIDFAILNDNENTRVFIKSGINNEGNIKPGYSIFVEGVGVFQLLKENDLSEEDKKILLQYSAVSIALNSLRGFIGTLTANTPFGRYLLPSIDVNYLFHQKIQAVKSKSKKAKK